MAHSEGARAPLPQQRERRRVLLLERSFGGGRGLTRSARVRQCVRESERERVRTQPMQKRNGPTKTSNIHARAACRRKNSFLCLQV